MERVSHFLFHKYIFSVTFEDVSFYIYKKGEDRCLQDIVELGNSIKVSGNFMIFILVY